MPVSFHQACIHYLNELRTLRGSAVATEELSLRAALDRFLKQVAEIPERPVQFIGEGKSVKVGRPDFTVTLNDLPIGYVEAETYGVDLDHLTGHAKEQNDRFRANLDNFLLTNHLEFRLYVGGALVDSAKLSAPPDKGKVSVEDDAATKLTTLLAHFLRGQPPTIASPRDLAIHLARRTRQMHNEALEGLKAQSSDLKGNYEAFKEVLLPDLTEEEFADMYAQTIAYGLFAARCAAPSGKDFSRESAAKLVPKTNPFLRRLFQRIAEYDLDERVAWIADDTAQLLAQADIGEILADFGKRTGKEDPVVHFYETFLAAYDPKLRELRGVYYTPEPVVSYIVRSIDHLLRTHFHKPMGLADENTLILDPATGTGSFLFAVVNQVREIVSRTIGRGAWSDYVEKRLLPRLFGFELLVASYAVAHLKLGLLLQEMGYDFKGDQRVGIYLTNTLEEALKKSELLMGRFISDEANEAVAIKRERPILVVLGNPPYSGHSANRSRDERGNLTFIGKLIEDCKQVDGAPLGEKNPKWLQDDYVKFIRFAQWRIAETKEGVIGYITNHGYLDNPTFRGMRQHLMRTFNEIYVYNLHGNTKKKERAPDGSKDENVFDIQQGVAILLCVKQPVAWASCPREDMGGGGSSATNMGETPMPPCRVYHADLWGAREVHEETSDGQRLVGGKYHCLWENSVATTKWTELQPSSPFYLFVPQNTELLAEYEQGWKVTEVMTEYSLGCLTKRNDLVIDFTPDEVRQRILRFIDPSKSDEQAAAEFELRLVDKDMWNTHVARTSVVPEQIDSFIRSESFRPFDTRFIFYHEKFVARLNRRVMRHLDHNNLALITVRQLASLPFDHIWVTNALTDQDIISVRTKEGGVVFPLHLYPDASGLGFDTNRRLNLSPAFLKALAEKLNLPQTKPHGLPEGITPEDIFHYAYAVFHSPTYRTRYAAFLKMDFPRLPLTSDLELFRDLAALGKQLVALHLLDFAAAPSPSRLGLFPVAGSNEVEKVRYVEPSRDGDGAAEMNGRVYINKTQYFDTVPPEVWEFHIGGYQVCDKWLKDRKGRRLTIDDIQHYQRIVVALRETIRLMAEIDERIPGFPIS